MLPSQDRHKHKTTFNAHIPTLRPRTLQKYFEMSLKRFLPRAEDFTVAWICALPVELTAAAAVLNDEYEDSDETAQYKLGRIGRHNVVIVCLPAGQIGTVSAAAVAAELPYKFPAVKIGLMVGIGGGVPSLEADIRLGDVVISQPQGLSQIRLARNRGEHISFFP